MRRAHRLLAGLLTAGALLTVTAGCAQSVDPIERLGRKAVQRVKRPPSAPAVRPGAGRTEAVRPAAVRGDHGAPGARVVVRERGARALDVRNGPGTSRVLPVAGR